MDPESKASLSESLRGKDLACDDIGKGRAPKLLVGKSLIHSFSGENHFRHTITTYKKTPTEDHGCIN
jgi:hypothetical protein